MTNPKSKGEQVLGIDLGTTNSAAAIFRDSSPITIPSAEGQSEAGKMFASAVSFTKTGQVIVGENARKQLTKNPKGTILEIKRKIGTDYKITIEGKVYTPQQISALILKKIKSDAESFLQDEIKKAVITVPAYFNDHQRQATIDAGEIAGLQILRIINEPTAACLAYGLDRDELDEEITAMVVSFGGGTHDVTTMNIKKGTFKVIATSGDTLTGGTDIDDIIIERLKKYFTESTGVDPPNDSTTIARLKDTAEQAKIRLSHHLAVEIQLPFFAQVDGKPRHLEYTLTQQELEELALPIVKRLEPTIKTVLFDSRLGADEIDKLILIGGQTRMPLVRRVVEGFMNKVVEEGVDPMECVALGAAIQGAILTGKLDYQLLDVTPLSLGVENTSGMVTRIIERNMPIPTIRKQIFTTSRDDQKDVTIHILQGERPMASDNVSIGTFDLVGIPLKPRGVPQIEVTFEIDANGILKVSASEKASGINQTVTITGRIKLTDDEKRRMIKDAELFSGIDRIRRDKAELGKTIELLIYKAEKLKKELVLPAEAREKIDKMIIELNSVSDGIDEKKIYESKMKIIELTELLEETVEIYQIGAGL